MPAPDEPTQSFPTPDDSGGGGWVLGGRYRITGRIGSGGMADVFRAHDELLARDVAVKVFRSAAATADTAAGLERQRAELHALARLNHPNLITLYDGSITGVHGERAYLVMELVEGPNLGDRIDQGPLPTEAEARIIGAQVAEALAYVHDQGMVHRDVKPANILLGAGIGSEQIRARLSDFGIVRLLGADRLTQADSTLGTASYLAPEQARGSGVGPTADVYALGLTLIEALTGVRSFDGPTPIEAVVARLDRDPEIPQHLPLPWPPLLTAMTARDPAARPTAAQVGETLRGTAGATTQFIPAAGAAGAAAAAAAAAGSTSMIPAAGAVMPPVRPTYEPVPVDDPEPRRRNTGLIVGLILAAVLFALGAAVLIASSGGGDDNGSTPSETPSQSSSRRSSSSSSSSRPAKTSQQPQQTEQNSAPAPSRTRTSTQQQPSTSRPPTTSAAPTTPPTTSRPPSTPTTPPTSASASTSSTPAAGAPVVPTASSTAP